MPNNDAPFGRGGLLPIAEGVYGPLGLDPLSAQLISQLLPPYAMLAAAGKLFALDMSGGTAKAPVVAMPTTSPEWALYNFSTTETMIVIRAAINLQGGLLGLGMSLVGAAAIGPQTAVTADYASAVKSAMNGSQAKPEVYLTNNPTLVGGTPAWHAFEGTKFNTIATNSVGDTLVAPVDGMLVAPPNGHMVAFEAVGETGTTALFDFQAIIAMVKMF